jgi:hypothetical protein
VDKKAGAARGTSTRFRTDALYALS